METVLVEIGYEYVWDGSVEEPWTDDPDRAGKLRRGLHNHTTLDGVEMPRVTRCKTGTDGWVEGFLEDDQGKYVIDHDRREIVRYKKHGYVRFWTDED